MKSKNKCRECDGTKKIEVMGNGQNFEYDVVGYKICRCASDREREVLEQDPDIIKRLI